MVGHSTMRNGIQIKPIFTQIVITILVVLVILKLTPSGPTQIVCAQDSTELKKIDQLRLCLNLAYDEEPKKNNYILRYKKCIAEHVKDIEFDKFGENKLFLPQRNLFKGSGCIWLTIGIGGTANAEMLFKYMYPDCNVYGIEPSSDQYGKFDKYGTIIPYGVGVTNGVSELRIREGEKYVNKSVEIMEMKDLLDKYVGSRVVHYMTIDIEGFEYTILEELLYGKILYNQKIVFCQIDAELHGEDKDKAANILHKFDSYASAYIPIYAVSSLQNEKVTWINIKNEECKKAFEHQIFL